MAVSSNIVDFASGMRLLCGFDNITLSPHGASVNIEGSPSGEVTPAPLPGGGGQTTSMVIKLVNRQTDLAESLRIDVKASLRYALFGGGSAKFNFSESTRTSAYTLDLLIYVKVTNSEQTVNLHKTELTDAARLAYDTNMQTFNETFGNTFVYGLVSGGELFIHLSLQSESEESLKSMSASISGSGGMGAWSGSASVDALRRIREAINSFTMTCTIERTGDDGPLPNINDQNDIIEYALIFPTKVQGNGGVPIQALIMPYEHQFVSTIAPTDRQNQIESLELLGKLRNDTQDNLNDHVYALGHPEQFPGVSVHDLTKNIDKISLAKDNIETLARHCFNNAVSCELPSADIFESAKIAIPPRKFDNNLSEELLVLANRPIENVNAARDLLDRGANVNFRDMYGETPLYLATGAANEALVIFFVDEKNAEINPRIFGLQPQYNMWTPLSLATYLAQPDVTTDDFKQGSFIRIAEYLKSKGGFGEDLI